jgi:adenylylsulfate kinase-like enzyme
MPEADMPVAAAAANAYPTARAVPNDVLCAALRAAMEGKDLEVLSTSQIRQEVAQKLGFAVDGLDSRKKEIKKILKALVQEITAVTGEIVSEILSIVQDIMENQLEKADAR